MADPSIILEVSKRLRDVVQKGCKGLEVGTISLAAPGPSEGQGAAKVWLWLYKVSENEFLKNEPGRQVAVQSAMKERFEDRPTPLALDLSYLVAIDSGTADTDQLILGCILRVLYDNSRLRVPLGDGGTGADDVSVILSSQSFEDATKIWDALNERYRLSVSYVVRVVRIDSQRSVSAGRIVDRELHEEALA